MTSMVVPAVVQPAWVVRLPVQGLALGLLSALGFAPLGWWVVCLLSTGALYGLVLRSPSPGAASAQGLAYGVGLHALAHGWIYTSLHNHVTPNPLVAASFTLAVLALLGACYAAAATWSWYMTRAWPQRDTIATVSTFASCMTLWEWGRSQVTLGFSSGNVGYAMMDSWLSSLAPWLGLYGVTWCVYAIGAASFAALFPQVATARTARGKLLGAACAMLVVCAVLDSWPVQTQAFGPVLTYKLVQTGTPQNQKFDPRERRRISNAVTAQVADPEPANLVVTSETVYPFMLHELPAEAMQDIAGQSERSDAHMFLGIATSSADNRQFNSYLHMQPGRRHFERYDKVHLMPMGEFTPPGLSLLTAGVRIPMSDMSAGAAMQAPFMVQVAGHTLAVATLMCQEDMVNDTAMRWTTAPNLILNPSNMAWFDATAAPEQRLQVARMRAKEVGLPLLRATPTGVTSAIDELGRVKNALATPGAGTLRGQIQARTGTTLFAKAGNFPILALCALTVICSFWLMPKQSKNSNNK